MLNIIDNNSTLGAKVSINAALIKSLPKAVAEQVIEWKKQYRKRRIRIKNTEQVRVSEDSYYTAYSPEFSSSKTIQAAGEFAGMTSLSPTALIDIPFGAAVVEEQIFCGTPYLTIYVNRVAPIVNQNELTE